MCGSTKEKILPKFDTENEAAEKLSDFYIEKISKIREKISKDISNIPQAEISTKEDLPIHMNNFEEIDKEELMIVLSSTKKKTSKLDPAPTEFVAIFLESLVPFFLHLINSCIKLFIFPENLKHAIITPVIKDSKLDSQDLQNYRPISNLSYLAKILERCLYRQLENYIERKKLHANFQSAYRKNNSCETALIRVINDIQQDLFNKNYVALLLLDSSSAFDTIDQNILIKKLRDEFYIGNNSLNMIKSYLQNRTFSVSINQTTSQPKHLCNGVPQGSLLGPLMYILYTKGLEGIAQEFGLKINTYADDVQLYVSFNFSDVQNKTDNMKKCLAKIKEWMDLNYLKLNPGKTQLQIFNPNNHSIPFNLNFLGQTINPVNEVNVLGVKLTNNMDVKAFISRKTQVCNLQLRNLNNIRNSLSFKSKVTLITNTVISQLDYCNSILACVNQTAIRPLQLLLNRGIRFIFGINRYTHITKYMKTLHVLPIKYRILFKLGLIAYKIFYRKAPEYLLMNFQTFQRNTRHNLRTDTGRDQFMFIVEVPKHKKECIFYKIKKHWNSLPLLLRNLDKIGNFKRQLKAHMFRMAFPETTVS